MIRKNTILKFGLPLVVLAFAACTKDPNSPGYEYMPDMYRSPAVEAYVDYDKPEVMSARTPVNGTIPFSSDKSKAAYNFPYGNPNTPAGYEMSASLKNPIEFTDAVLKEGEKLYKYFCMHCHGENGDGQGILVTNGKFLGVPAYNSGALKTLPEGKMFHVITYGKGNMGSHAGQVNREERWKLIHYVKYLQNDKKAPMDSTAVVASADTIVTAVNPPNNPIH
jgi:mono/diheme cytochrome c family protein